MTLPGTAVMALQPVPAKFVPMLLDQEGQRTR
jgi:hypothetical protein